MDDRTVAVGIGVGVRHQENIWEFHQLSRRAPNPPIGYN